MLGFGLPVVEVRVNVLNDLIYDPIDGLDLQTQSYIPQLS